MCVYVFLMCLTLFSGGGGGVHACRKLLENNCSTNILYNLMGFTCLVLKEKANIEGA